MGNTKGLLWVLWDRVFMDTSKYVCTYNTLRGQEDTYGNIILETSLRELMRICPDVIEDEKLLQTNACNMGQRKGHIIVGRTLNYHPELSGEGIEYSWIFGNNHFILISLYKKKGKKKSRTSVQEEISRYNLTTKRVFMFSRHAW